MSGSPYKAPIWLPSGNLQTIYSANIASRIRINYLRERWKTPDDDFIDLDWLNRDKGSTLYVLFHGLEGSSNSHYAKAFMAAVRQKSNASGVVVHFRGCSGELNHLPRAYHSGDSTEIDWVLKRIRELYPKPTILVTGVSLGGNALLKWLGEQGPKALAIVKAASAVCSPMDLKACGLNLQVGFNMFYTRLFLQTLKKKSLAKLEHFPGLFDSSAMQASRNLYEFDNVVTAPLHGYKDTEDYWVNASSKPLLKNIAVPTLILNSLNDPFIPANSLPKEHEVSKFIQLEYPETGGHVGFVSGSFPGNINWLPDRLIEYFNSVI